MNFYEAMAYNSTDMLAVVSLDYKYLAVNKAYAKAFKLEVKDFNGLSLSDLFEENFFNARIKPAALKCFEKGVYKYQHWLSFTEPNPKFIDVVYVNYYNHNDEHLGFIVNARDLTDLKLAENKIKLESKQLKTKNSKLEASNKSLAEYATYAANELIAPINTIRSLAGEIKAKLEDKIEVSEVDLVEYLEMNTMRVLEVAENMLKFSSQKKEVEIQDKIILNSIFHDVLLLLRDSILDSRLAINVGELPVIHNYNPSLLMHVMQILITNAIGHVNPDEPKPVLDVKAIDGKDKDVVHLVFENNGNDIDEVDKKVLSNSTSDKVKFRTGLGLSICNNIIEYYGGRFIYNRPDLQTVQFHLILKRNANSSVSI